MAGAKAGQRGRAELVRGARHSLDTNGQITNGRITGNLPVFLHGSNMNGWDYLRTIEANKWADEDILCCPNGENGSDPYGQNNLSQGSGPLVAEGTTEVQKALKTTLTYVGGTPRGLF